MFSGHMDTVHPIGSFGETPVSFDDEKILELAESIRSNGIIQPLVLKKVDNEYIIVSNSNQRCFVSKVYFKGG